MPSMSPPPQRPQAPGASLDTLSGYGSQAASSRPLLGGDLDFTAEHQLSIADFFAQALDGAMALVHADGGEIAVFDETRQVMVLRARRTRPRFDPALGPMGIPARQSQPRGGPGGMPPAHASHASHASQPSNPSFPALPYHAELAGSDESAALLDGIDAQSTVLLPATMISRSYRRGERLIGHTWQKGDWVLMSGDDCRALPGGTAPADPDAPHHLAVPILRPGSLAMIRPNSEVIGVIAVYNRDPLWKFTARDAEQLMLHADRVARAMRVAELSRQKQTQAELLEVLAADVGALGAQSLYPRLRDVVRRMMDAPSFAFLQFDAQKNAVSFELAERDNQPVATSFVPASTLPPWWNIVRTGRTHWISAPEDRAGRGEYCVLGWGDAQPVQSILAAPLMIGNTFMGALVAGSPRPDVYAPEHVRLFSTMARSAAIVIENTRLSHETHVALLRTREKQAQLSLLNNAVLSLNASLDLDATLRVLVKQAHVLANVECCLAFLLDTAGEGELEARATNVRLPNPQMPLGEVRLPFDWHRLDAVLRTQPFAHFDDLDAEWDDDTVTGRFLRAWQIRSALLLPIERIEHAGMQAPTTPYGDRPLGVLMVYSPGLRHHFSSEDIGLLHGLVSQAAIAVTNARLFQAQQDLNRTLQIAIERQQELDRLKDEFILTVSHEFRTPVTAIEGYVTLIGRHGHKLEQSKLDQFASEIRQATAQLMSMITMLHDANSIETRPLELTVRPVHLCTVAERAIATQSPEARARMQLEIADDLLVLADGDRLTHVFTNLLSNAVKYSPPGAPCHVSARLVTREALAAQNRPHAKAEDAPERWVIAGVLDGGAGIAPEDQDKLFHKFVRLSRSLTTSVRGTGLGLWICRQYVEAMGGDIWVESEFGKGAHFQFSLPIAAAP